MTSRSWLSEVGYWALIACITPILTVCVYWGLAWEATLHFRTWDGCRRDKLLSLIGFLLYIPMNYIGPRPDSWREMWEQAFELSTTSAEQQRAIEERGQREAEYLRSLSRKES